MSRLMRTGALVGCTAALGGVLVAGAAFAESSKTTQPPKHPAGQAAADPQAASKCLYQPLDRNWSCEIKCTAASATVTYRYKPNHARYARTSISFDSGKVSAINKTHYVADTYHGILDWTSSKVLWPTSPPPDYLIVGNGHKKTGKIRPPKKGHILTLKAGKFIDAAEGRCRVK